MGQLQPDSSVDNAFQAESYGRTEYFILVTPPTSMVCWLSAVPAAALSTFPRCLLYLLEGWVKVSTECSCDLQVDLLDWKLHCALHTDNGVTLLEQTEHHVL